MIETGYFGSIFEVNEHLFGPVHSFCVANELREAWSTACLELIGRKIIRVGSFGHLKTILQTVEATKKVG